MLCPLKMINSTLSKEGAMCEMEACAWYETGWEGCEIKLLSRNIERLLQALDSIEHSIYKR